MPLWLEHHIPWIVAAVTGGVLFIADKTVAIASFPSLAIGGTMTVGVVVAGFTATQRNQFLAIRGSRIFRIAAKSGYHRHILVYLAQGIYGALFLVTVSLLGFFVGACSWPWTVWMVLWGAAIGYVISALARNEMLMSRIFDRLIEEEESRRDRQDQGVSS